MSLYRIPRRFYDDHRDRDLPSPEIVKSTKQHYWINNDDPHVVELLSDAKHYADPSDWGRGMFGICQSAIATVRSLTGDIA